MTYTFEIGEKIEDNPAMLSYRLTIDHAASSNGVPVLVSPDGTAYGPEDILPLRGDAACIALEWSVYGGGFIGADENYQDAVDAARRFGTM